MLIKIFPPSNPHSLSHSDFVQKTLPSYVHTHIHCREILKSEPWFYMFFWCSILLCMLLRRDFLVVTGKLNITKVITFLSSCFYSKFISLCFHLSLLPFFLLLLLLCCCYLFESRDVILIVARITFARRRKNKKKIVEEISILPFVSYVNYKNKGEKKNENEKI